ncbi:aKG-HExxH-type peptide beta-hydroxylase [Kitasatospora sp. NPDC017646]|uniref:aKG-HExxH-type peptide beta-hydroxylase n=1 Tax=Kitasatospora sp. NPDC017646 TaxID=3364024 RepID=UPI0037A39D10
MNIDLAEAVAGRNPKAYAEAHGQFVSHQLDRFAALTASLHAADRPSFEQLTEAVAVANPLDVERVVTAPVVTRRLRTTAWKNPVRFADDVATFLLTERASRGEAHVDSEKWTALGDTLVHPDGSLTTPISVPGLRAVDIASPQALAMNAETSLCEEQSRPSPAEDTVRLVGSRLKTAVARMEEISPALRNLVSTCVLSLVVSEDPALQFSSSSHGLFVGRVALAARAWESAPLTSFVDALVHESIHCMLLMLDRQSPLLIDDLKADALPPVISPWTGTPLTVPAYVHAIMVWFGLAHFWRDAHETSAFPTEESTAMLRRALRGFENCDVVARMLPEAYPILPDRTVHSLTVMQSQVRDLMSSALR